jgi:hypothetical protein
MSINIKNKEAEALVAELKARTGKGTTDLLLDLLRREKDRLEGDRRAAEERRIEQALAAMRKLQDTWSKLPVIDPRPIEEILQFDEDGLPI